MERPAIGPGEVVLASGTADVPSRVIVGPGESVLSRRDEMHEAAGRLGPSEALAVEIEGELEREQLESLLTHAEELNRRMELRFAEPVPEAIGSGEIIFAKSIDLESAEVTVAESGRLEFDRSTLEQAQKPVNVVIEGSALSAQHARDLVALARDADAALRVGFSER